jgi:hypothetical protein
MWYLGIADYPKDAVLKFGGFVVLEVEVCARIPVLACLRIVVGNTAVGIVERAFESFAGTVFLIVLEDDVSHVPLLVAMYVL